VVERAFIRNVLQICSEIWRKMLHIRVIIMMREALSGLTALILATGTMAVHSQVSAFGQGDASLTGSDRPNLADDARAECTNCMFGVDGRNDIGNGLKAIYGAGWAYDGQKRENRDRWLGVSGDFGEVKFGNLSTASRAEGVIPEPAFRPSTMNSSGLSSDFAGYAADTRDSANKGGDVGLTYANAGLLIFADYISGSTANEDTAYNVGAKLATDTFAVFGQYRIDTGTSRHELTATAPTDNTNIWFLGGSLTVGETSIYAGYGRGDDTVNAGAIPGYDAWEIVGVRSVGKLTSIYAGYSGTGCSDKNADACSTPGSDAVDADKFSLGIRHNF
jgi:predicted porin